MTENSISTWPCFLSISAQMLFVSTNMKECWLCKTFCWSSPLLRKNSHCVCFKSHWYLCTCSKIITNHNKSWQKRFSEMISWEFPRTVTPFLRHVPAHALWLGPSQSTPSGVTLYIRKLPLVTARATTSYHHRLRRRNPPISDSRLHKLEKD